MAALGLCCCMCAYSCGSQASPCSACSSCGSRARGHTGFSGCGSWAQGPRDMSLVVPWSVGSSRTRDRTRVPCDGKRILNHWATREVQFYHFLTGLLAVQPSSFVTKMFLSPPPPTYHWMISGYFPIHGSVNFAYWLIDVSPASCSPTICW